MAESRINEFWNYLGFLSSSSLRDEIDLKRRIRGDICGAIEVTSL